MKNSICCLVSALALIPLGASADLVNIDVKTQTFQNTDCAKTDSCDLKDFIVRQEDYRLTVPAQNITAYGTRMHAYYDTSSVSALEKYGIAQFIQGCVFTSALVNGTVQRDHSIWIPHEGQDIPYYFPNKAIDSFGSDPLDWGGDPQAPSRLFYYLNKYIGSKEPADQDYYGVQKPSVPRLYLRDMPDVAQLLEAGNATNLSLQFQTCIYKSADVPKNVASSNVNFATPLKCFEWNSSFVYNFDTQGFDRPEEIVDFCK